jgi:hypothetical protein
VRNSTKNSAVALCIKRTKTAMHVIFRAIIFSKHFSFASFSFVATKENEEEKKR